MRKVVSLSAIVLLATVSGRPALRAGEPAAAAPEIPAIAEGPFAPEWESLERFECPEWFRDAKLGIWSHWGPQAVPMAGDWYAKHQYVQGHPQYQHHLENYGHPSKFGHKDLIALWKAEKWDPDRLMALYKKAGARYFVSMGVHHDNFDLWNSTYQRWNAVTMGPKRDVVGDWQKAAKANGLRFGVSEHLGASFTWFQPSHGSDKTGDLAGVPYDGADPQYQDLYHWPAAPDDTGWYSKDPRWHATWFRRIKDLIDQYHPDLVYTDGGVPFEGVGRSLIAHLYNQDPRRAGDDVDVVYTCKQESKGMWVQDLERGVMKGILKDPWQTDTSIGDWYYNKSWKFRGADWVIHMLVDIVSKNGNLLLNVVQRPDGSLDPEAEQILAEMAEWIAIHGEGIYETRPWLVHGEGKVRAKGGHFNEDYAYTARDIRFTAKGDSTLYAFALGWPEDRKIVIRSLAKLPETTGKIADVRLLGSAEPPTWRHEAAGLAVELPARSPCKYAIALRISGEGLRGFRPDLVVTKSPPVLPDASGAFALLPGDADLHGEKIREEGQGGAPNIGFWDDPEEWVYWTVQVEGPRSFQVTATTATVHQDASFAVEVGGRTLEGKAPVTGGWDRFVDVELGAVELPAAGEHPVKVRARDAKSWKAINLRAVRLSPKRR